MGESNSGEADVGEDEEGGTADEGADRNLLSIVTGQCSAGR